MCSRWCALPNAVRILDVGVVARDPSLRLCCVTGERLQFRELEDDRMRLSGRVDRIMHKGVHGREELLRDIRRGVLQLVRHDEHQGDLQGSGSIDYSR